MCQKVILYSNGVWLGWGGLQLNDAFITACSAEFSGKAKRLGQGEQGEQQREEEEEVEGDSEVK